MPSSSSAPAPAPARATGSAPAKPETNDDAEPEFDPDDDEDMDDGAPLFPTTHELVLKDHGKVLSAIAMEPSGARVVSGAHDYHLKMWDFGGMASDSAKPFKSWEPAGSYYVNDIKYSTAADMFLVVSATLQAKLYDREGDEKGMFMKGDPYLRDMHHTA